MNENKPPIGDDGESIVDLPVYTDEVITAKQKTSSSNIVGNIVISVLGIFGTIALLSICAVLVFGGMFEWTERQNLRKIQEALLVCDENLLVDEAHYYWDPVTGYYDSSNGIECDKDVDGKWECICSE